MRRSQSVTELQSECLEGFELVFRTELLSGLVCLLKLELGLGSQLSWA